MLSSKQIGGHDLTESVAGACHRASAYDLRLRPLGPGERWHCGLARGHHSPCLGAVEASLVGRGLVSGPLVASPMMEVPAAAPGQTVEMDLEVSEKAGAEGL